MEVEVHASRIEVTEQGDEVLERPTEAADAPACDHVELFAGDAFHQGIEARSLLSSLGSAYAFISEGGDDVPSETFASQPQVSKLVLDGLTVSRGNTAIKCNALAHGAETLMDTDFGKQRVPAIPRTLRGSSVCRLVWPT